MGWREFNISKQVAPIRVRLNGNESIHAALSNLSALLLSLRILFLLGVFLSTFGPIALLVSLGLLDLAIWPLEKSFINGRIQLGQWRDCITKRVLGPKKYNK